MVDKCVYLFNKNDIESHIDIWNSAHSKKILENSMIYLVTLTLMIWILIQMIETQRVTMMMRISGFKLSVNLR